MKKFTTPLTWVVKMMLVVLLFLLCNLDTRAQQLSISDFVIFGGSPSCPNGAGQAAPPFPGCAVQLGSSTSIQGGAIGSYRLVRTTGNTTINASIFSGGRVELTNSNVVTGRITAANGAAETGNIVSIGSSLNLGGNLDANGNILIGGGTVSGRVTHPVGTNYSGPTPAGGRVIGAPNLPVLPELPAIVAIPAFRDTNISTNATIRPGSYGNVTLGGSRTLTFNGPGVYVFRSIKNSGNINKFVFNFNNSSTGVFQIYIHGDADLSKISATLLNGGSASRIYTTTYGNGSSFAGGPYSFVIANGSSSNNASRWLGTVYAPNAGINIGSGTGNSFLTGALISGTQVNIQSGVTVNFVPFSGCQTPNANAGADISLEFANINTLTGSSTTPNVTYAWQPLNGGVISTNPNQAAINVTAAGTYVLTVTGASGCSATDTVIVNGKVTNLIGSELQSLYENYNPNNPPSPFFTISNNRVFIDVIVKENQYNTALSLLQTSPYGLDELISNGDNIYIITGSYPIANLKKLDSLPNLIVYVRPYYRALFKNGLTSTAGDVSVRSNLVRAGYGLSGDGVKVGVISDSYNTITTATTTPVITNTAAQDITNGDLPGPGNPNGYTKPVQVLKEYTFRSTDEGRAMLQIIHDMAPKSELYFYTGFNTAGDFAKGIRTLRDSGCQVIVDDVTIITEPFLRDGIIAQAVEEVAASGTTYISAAGNFAGKSYENAYVSAPSPGGLPGTAHDFNPGAGVDVFQSVTLQPGNYTIVLQWVDNFYSLGETTQGGTQTDLDLYITPFTDGTGFFGFNRNNLNGDPIEILPFTLGATTTANFVVVNATPNRNPARFKFVIFRGELAFNEYVTGTSTIIGQSNALNCISVGAARYDKAPPFPGPLVQESFSSVGGTQVNGILRNKPDIVGPNGVNTTVNMGVDYDNDNYSNFFGSSAAAPHVAAVAALITEGRRKYLNENTTSPALMRNLLTQTAQDMGTPGFDFASGFGFINSDSAMRTFANPDPSLIQLVIPPNATPGTDTFQLTLTGFNISPYSVVQFRDSTIQTTYVNSTTATAIIYPFIGNPGISVFTPAQSVSGLDGGSSDTLTFFNVVKKNVVIKVNNDSKLYAQSMPDFSVTVLVDGDSLQNTSLTLADLGLESITYQTQASQSSNVGTYQVTPVRVFDENNTDDRGFLELYNYSFQPGTFSVSPLPVTVKALDQTATYGEKIANVQFTYTFNGTGIPDSAALHQTIQQAHESQLAKDVQQNDIIGLVNSRAVAIVNGRAVAIVNGRAVAIVNGRAVAIVNGRAVAIVNGQSLEIDANGIVTDTTEYELSSTEVSNLSFKATENSLQGARAIQNRTLVNGTYVTGQTQVVDITQENILNFLQNSAQTQMLNAISDVGSRGLIDNSTIANGRAVAIVNGADDVQVINGLPITVTNGRAVAIVNGQELTLFNGRAVAIVNGQAVTFVNGTEEPVVAEQKKDAVIVDSTEIGSVSSNLKSINMITGLDAGSQLIIPGNFDNSNFLVNHEPGVLNITPATVNITPDPGQSKVYGDADPVYTFTNNAGLPVEEFTGSLSRISGETVGDYPYQLGTLSAGPNYVLNLVSINTFAVTGRAITITPNAGQFKLYGNADPVFTYTASQPLQPGDNFTGSLQRNAGESVSAGPYAYTLGTLSAGSNYILTLGGTNRFSIQARPVTITPATGQFKVYGDADPVFTYTPSESLIAGNSFSGSLGRVAGSSVANSPYAFTLGSLSAGSNYTLSLAVPSPTFEIRRAALIVKARDTFMYRGETVPSFRSDLITLKNGDANPGVTYTLNPATVTTAGVYTITPALNNFAASGNYTISIVTGTLYVNPKGPGAKKLRNYLDCVLEDPTATNPARRYIARFYCLNDNTTPLYVPIGIDNKLSSTGGSFDGSNQPVIFNPGRTDFNVAFDGLTLKWELRTFESTKKTATSTSANTSSSRCSFTRGNTVPQEEASVADAINTSDEPLLFPNPAKDRVVLRTGQFTVDHRQLTLTDAFGRSYSVRIARRISAQAIELNLLGLSKGIYFIRVLQNGEFKTLRLLKD